MKKTILILGLLASISATANDLRSSTRALFVQHVQGSDKKGLILGLCKYDQVNNKYLSCHRIGKRWFYSEAEIEVLSSGRAWEEGIGAIGASIVGAISVSAVVYGGETGAIEAGIISTAAAAPPLWIVAGAAAVAGSGVWIYEYDKYRNEFDKGIIQDKTIVVTERRFDSAIQGLTAELATLN